MSPRVSVHSVKLFIAPKPGIPGMFAEDSMKLIAQTLLVASVLCIAPSAFAQGRLVGITGTTIYEISMTDGSLTQIGTIASGGGTISELSYDWNNGILYMANSSNQNLYTLDIDTGVYTTVGTYGLGSTPVMHGLEYNSGNNTLYGHSGGSTHGYHLYSINTSNAAASFIGTSSLTSFHNLGYNSHTNVMYMTNSSTDSLYTIDLTTNVSTLVGSLVNSTNPNGLAFNHHTGVMYMIDNSTDNLYTLNLQTGVATAVGSVGSSNFLSLAYIPVVPGPGALLVFGLAAIAPRRRR